MTPLLKLSHVTKKWRNEDSANRKILVDFKMPSEMSDEEFQAVVVKNNWNARVKYHLYSISMISPDVPVRLCHLVMHAASKLKIFGDDAFCTVTLCCRVGAEVVNYLMVKNCVFFPLGGGCTQLPVHACPLNDETFKNTVVGLLKCSSDTNHQRNYVGDRDGGATLVGLGVSPIALTNGPMGCCLELRPCSSKVSI